MNKTRCEELVEKLCRVISAQIQYDCSDTVGTGLELIIAKQELVNALNELVLDIVEDDI